MPRNVFPFMLVLITLTGAGCSLPPTAAPSQTETESPVSSDQTQTIDPHAIPIGDGKLSSEPKQGYVYSCVTQFNGRGAQHEGPWITGNTWDLTQKISVQGAVSWPTAIFSTSSEGTERVLSGNG